MRLPNSGHQPWATVSVCALTESNIQHVAMQSGGPTKSIAALLHAVEAFELYRMHVNRVSSEFSLCSNGKRFTGQPYSPPRICKTRRRMCGRRLSTNFGQIKLLNTRVPVSVAACSTRNRNFVSGILIIICRCATCIACTHFNSQFVIVRGQSTGTDFVHI